MFEFGVQLFALFNPLSFAFLGRGDEGLELFLLVIVRT